MDLKSLDPELRAKVKACGTPEEILALAKEEGYTLTDGELEQISGGGLWTNDEPKCPKCGSKDFVWGNPYNTCLNCGFDFEYY
jgi:predicted ribosomally synthesized peptide with nif11-like leader